MSAGSVYRLLKEIDDSKELFVMGSTQLSYLDDSNSGATGTRLTFKQAMNMFGVDILLEAMDRGTAVII